MDTIAWAFYPESLERVADLLKTLNALDVVSKSDIQIASPVDVLIDGEPYGQLVRDEGKWLWIVPSE